MLLYGCDNKDFYPNYDAITSEWSGLKDLGSICVGSTHMTLSAVVADPKLLQDISEINDMHKSGRWISTNLGIETVAPNLVKKHLGI